MPKKSVQKVTLVAHDLIGALKGRKKTLSSFQSEEQNVCCFLLQRARHNADRETH
jgi:hypothetical protein